MSDYDPETLELLRNALDEAWLSLPQSLRSRSFKSDMAQRILQHAAQGERDPAKLRAAALVGAA